MSKDEMQKVIGMFFSKYLWLGIIWLLLAIIINDNYGGRFFGVDVLVDLIISISIAIIVASIFTYTASNPRK